ncbi:MAG: TonB family protein [Enterobacterales bacterium]|nr:TonB family protein [Enterobacterales bacterium]
MLKSIIKIHAKKVYFRGFLCLLLLVCSSFASSLEVSLDKNTRLSLFSVAVHRESLNDIYIATLFAPNDLEDYQQLSDPSLAKRMSFKFLSRYSTRQMSRLIKQRIALNNPKSAWHPYTAQIVKIANLFKNPMQTGDQLDIDYIPSQGTKIYLNKTLFLTIPQAEVFNLLLNIWIGNIPPSESFKIAIRDHQAEDKKQALEALYQSIETEVGRFDQQKTKPKTTKVATSKVTKPKKKKVKKVSSLPPPISSPTAKIKPPVKKAKKNVTLKAKQVEPKKTIQKTVPLLNNSPDLAENRVPINIPITIAKQEVDKDLLSGSYTQTLIAHIRKHQYYPKNALVAEVQGSVLLRITLDSEGIILTRKLMKRSGSRILDRGVLKMVNKANPFPTIPKELEVTTFVFDVPLNFTLSD